MAAPEDEMWFDEDAGRLVRLYTVSDGRTNPTTKLTLLSLVRAVATVSQSHLSPEHVQVLGLCRNPTSVAEVAAHIRMPAAITKVILSDLIDCGAVATQQRRTEVDPTDRSVLEALLSGLRQRL